jgi:hypothetical protein
LDEAAAFVLMLEDDSEIKRLLSALREQHTRDATAPLMSAFARAAGAVEMLAIEIRHIRNLLGGAS